MSMTTPELGRVRSDISRSLRDYWGVFLFEGIALLLLGMIAIIVPVIATLTITIAFGWIFLVSGIIGLVTTAQARRAPGFWWSLLSAVLGVVVGLLLLVWPITGALSLTMLLAAFFAVEGIFSIMYSIEHKREMSGRWGWILLNGVVDLGLSAIILIAFQTGAGWVLGLLIGIDMVLGGTALIAIALEARATA
jgi:uncharacterized membrane protein HdeD (DUF308 family)